MTVNLEDYKPYPFEIPSIELNFEINSENVVVLSMMKVKPLSEETEPLLLKGSELDLVGIRVNGRELPESEYIISELDLIYTNPPKDPLQGHPGDLQIQ